MKMRILNLIIIFLFLVRFCSLSSQTKDFNVVRRHTDSILAPPIKPVRAAGEIVGLNVGVWAFGRYIQNADYSRISWQSMKRNFRKGFVWDNDQFSTNLLAHPYHGSLYFNAARSNGMSFQTSALFTAGGSLMWEYLMENELPSINDFIATPIGGVCLGEITFRLSNSLIDDRETGWPRFGRELLAALVNPVQGLNRIFSGEAWRYRSFKGQYVKNSPLRVYAIGGHRLLAKNRNIELDNGMFIDVNMYYGHIFSEDSEQPYNTFTINSTFNFISRQPIVGYISVVSQLWGTNIALKDERFSLHWGIFQHFDYYNSNLMFEKEQASSYRISEAAAFGIGGQLKGVPTEKTTFIASLHLNAILLGGCKTDYYRVSNRDYNIGNGFSSKIDIGVIYKTKAAFDFHAETYQLFTYKGYDPQINFTNLTSDELLHLNVQGDIGVAKYTVLKLNFSYKIHKYCNLSIGTYYYLRANKYKYFPDMKNVVAESRIGLGYMF